MQIIRIFLFPVSMLYGFITTIRNWMFDLGILRSRSYNLPVISVGNLSVGGSGKTPMVEYLLRLLGDDKNLAVLSRGYKRKTKGYRLAGADESVETIGDEPLQYHQKFPDVNVAVCERRTLGMEALQKQFPDLKTVILDDAFQHRYVKPGLSILITEYSKLYTKDKMMPTGNLREPQSGSKRADIIVVTKAPAIFSPIVRRMLLQELKPAMGQTVCFSYIKYLGFVPLYPDQRAWKQANLKDIYSISLLTGIANPSPIEEYLRGKCFDLNVFNFPDHHAFTEKELLQVRDKFTGLPGKRNVLITTEKDAMRLQQPYAKEIFKDLPIFIVPISFELHKEDKPVFDKVVKDFVNAFSAKALQQ